MARDTIQTALNKLKSSRTEKEVELIDLVSSMYNNFKEVKEEATEKISESLGYVNDSVHKRPWYYIGGAALGGFLIGMLFHRR